MAAIYQPGFFIASPPVSLAGIGNYYQWSTPPGVKRFSMNFTAVSLDLLAFCGIQIGITSGIEGAGYVGRGGTQTWNTANMCALSANLAASASISGIFWGVLQAPATNTWVFSGQMADANTTVYTQAGYKALAGELARVQFLCGGGAVFDAGSVSFFYEVPGNPS